jgi:dihydrodipicolinate synthase/N-acetylneuraminate lyase
MKTSFFGIITPLATSLDSNGGLDLDSLTKLIDWQIERGVHGIFVLGTNGEGTLLTDEQKREVVRVASEAVRGRVALMCGVSDTSLPRVIGNIDRIKGSEVDAYVTTIPYYGVTSPEEQYLFLTGVCDRSDRPVIAYNIPSFVKQSIALEAIERAAEHERFAGVKESSDDLERYGKLLSLKITRPELALFTGCSHLMDVAYSMGFDGGVAGLANVAPALCAALHTAHQQADAEGAKKVQAGILRVMDRLNCYVTASRHSNTIAPNKAILAAMGIIRESTMVAPYLPVCEEDESVIHEICEIIACEEALLISR